MKFIFPLLLALLSLNSSEAQEAISSITVENYAHFLGSRPEADQYYDSGTMHDQIERVEEGDQTTYHPVDGQENELMLGLTDLQIACYSHWTEAPSTTSMPLMMFDPKERNKQDLKKEIELKAQRSRQRNSTSSSRDSSSLYGRGSSMPQVNERTPLLNKGASQSNSASLSSTRTPARTLTISQAQYQMIAARSNQSHRAPRSLGTAEERQPLLGFTTSSFTTRPAESARTVIMHSSEQRRTPWITALLTQSKTSSARVITSLEDVHNIDALINTTPWAHSTKEKEKPPFDGIAPRLLFFPQRMAAYLFPGSLGSKLQRDFNNLKAEQAHIQSKMPTLRSPIANSEIPNFLEQTQHWIETKKELTELSIHFLNRVMDVQDRKIGHVDAISPYLITAFKDVWLHEVNDLLEIHEKVKAAEALSSRFKNSTHLYSEIHSIGKMRKMSDYVTEKFLRKAELYIYLCEKFFSQKIYNYNSRNNLLQLALAMKEHLEGLRKIDAANTKLELAKSESSTRLANGNLTLIDDAKKQDLISAAERARDEAYRSYQRPTFNRQQGLLPGSAANRQSLPQCR